MDSSGLYVFPSYEEEMKHYLKKLKEANKTQPVVKIKAKGKGLHSSSVATDKAGGLVNILYPCRGGKSNADIKS